MENKFRIEFYGGSKDGEVLHQNELPPIELFFTEIEPLDVTQLIVEGRRLEFHHYKLTHKQDTEYQYMYQGMMIQDDV